jgi:hypothetical protein
MALTAAHLSMLLEYIDWRRPIRTTPVIAVRLAKLKKSQVTFGHDSRYLPNGLQP